MTVEASYQDWLTDALANGELALNISDKRTINHHATRFNTEIAAIIQENGEQRVNTALWFIYGVASGYMHDVLDPSLGEDRTRFMASVKTLYRDGFQRYCRRCISQNGTRAEAESPLNSACYMLWDMDGIECPAIVGDAELLDASLDVLRDALQLDHLACQESALHGLGHLASGHRHRTTPIINDYLEHCGSHELRQYAHNALVGCVL